MRPLCATRYELSKEQPPSRVRAHEIECRGIAKAETIEERGDGIAAKHAFLRREALRGRRLRFEPQLSQALLHQPRIRHLDFGTRRDAEGRDHRDGRQREQQETEEEAPRPAGTRGALR